MVDKLGAPFAARPEKPETQNAGADNSASFFAPRLSQPTAGQNRADTFSVTDESSQTTRVVPLSGSVASSLIAPRSASPKLSSAVSEQDIKRYPGMLAAQTKAFSANKPFFFVVRYEPSSAAEPKLEEGSVCYRRAVLANNTKDKREANAYYVSRLETQPRWIGTIEQVESDENPLAHHLLMVNDDVFCPSSYDPVEHEESLAAASILFDLGKGVEKSPATALLLLSRLSRERRADVFGSIFVEAIAEKDIAVAKACLPHGATLASIDREGRDALGELLEPGMEELLDLVCQRTALMTDFLELKAARSEAVGEKMDGIRRVLDRHIERLKDAHGG